MDRGTQLAHPCFDTIKRERYIGREKERKYITRTHTTVYVI